jgi:hypothetical protein
LQLDASSPDTGTAMLTCTCSAASLETVGALPEPLGTMPLDACEGKRKTYANAPLEEVGTRQGAF